MVSLEFANVMETMDLTKEEIKDLTLEELISKHFKPKVSLEMLNFLHIKAVVYFC